MSETFTADWLGLREPVDHRSRANDLLDVLGTWWETAGGSRIADLGSGTGSNLRYLAPRLSGVQEWTLVDHDAALLARAEPVGRVTKLERVVGNLAREGLEVARRADLVTGSALLDLVSETWLTRLADTCWSTRCGMLFALNFDGLIEWSDSDPDDRLVQDAVNSHQRRDKWLGPALGPTAGEVAERSFRAVGYRTWRMQTPWRLGAGDAALAQSLVDGWTRAAEEECPAEAGRIRTWAERRQHTVLEGAFVLIVGHVDLLALPGDAASQ
ncbi:MAG TPA: SAM-dependent methyltransferase [Gemmatimonadetes bacterium]|nr:SAM-dependent methyltransferase [Gemmatimonadota bacterium]